jgi:hypothetical protein
MEYVVPLIIVLVIVIAVVAASRLLGRRGRSQQANRGGSASAPASPRPKVAKGNREITRENAEAASARLTPEAHRRVYSLIAQHQVLNAVKEYRKATSLGLGDSAAAVAALAQFPQATPHAVVPRAEVLAEPQGPEPKERRLTVEDIINAAPEPRVTESHAVQHAVPEPTEAGPQPVATPSTYRYRAIVSQGGDVREVASTRLNEQIFRQIRDLALAGNYDGASRLLRDHADIGETEAQEFVAMIDPED